MRTKSLWLWLALSSRVSLWSRPAAAARRELVGTGATTEERRRRSRRSGDHGQLGHRAAVARPGPGDRHDLLEHPAEHHGSACQARRRSDPVAPPPRASNDRRRQDRHVHAPRPPVDERRPGHRTRLRVLVEADDLAQLGADYAYQFYGIVGAQEYDGSIRRRTTPTRSRKDGRGGSRQQDPRGQADEPAAVVHPAVGTHSFLAVNQKSSSSSATNGPTREHRHQRRPSRSVSGEHNANINLAKWDDVVSRLRQADAGQRPDDHRRHDRRQAFEAGEIDVLYQGLPPDEISRLKETPEYEQYPGLGTYYYGFNVKNITDVKQRRAMSLAIDRQSIIDNSHRAASCRRRVHAEGHARLRRAQPGSPWQPPSADMEQAKKLMGEVANPKKNITLYINDSPGHQEFAAGSRPPGRSSGSRARSAAGVPAVPGVPGAAPERGRRRLPARLDR